MLLLLLLLLFTLCISLASGSKALYDASKNGNVKEVERLLSQGDQPDQYKGYYGCTALIKAAQMGHSEIVSTLLEKGADFNACSFMGIFVLLLSVVFGRAKIIRMLLSSDIDGVVFAIIIILITRWVWQSWSAGAKK